MYMGVNIHLQKMKVALEAHIYTLYIHIGRRGKSMPLSEQDTSSDGLLQQPLI